MAGGKPDHGSLRSGWAASSTMSGEQRDNTGTNLQLRGAKGFSGPTGGVAAKVLRDGSIQGEEAYRLSWCFEPFHPSFPPAGGLVRVLGAVIQIPVLPMFHPGHDPA